MYTLQNNANKKSLRTTMLIFAGYGYLATEIDSIYVDI